MSIKKFGLIFMIGLALSAVLAACGGGAEEATGPAPATFNIKGYDEFRYDPASLEMQSGSEVTVNFENEGALEHNWILVDGALDVTTVSEADAVSRANVGLVPGGETGSVVFVAPAAGDYKMVCTVAGHAAGGMVGDVTVTP